MTDNLEDTGMPGSPAEDSAELKDEEVSDFIDDEVEIEEVSAETVWNRNAQLRVDYIAACARVQAARESGDEAELRAASLAREAVADTFVRINRGLVSANARPFLKGNHREDHEAAALMGLWEAFVGTCAATANEVLVDEDGNAKAASGWDPQAATFGTWSRSHISGRASRSVAAWDEKFHGVSYSTFQRAPAVRLAREELRRELGHEPTLAAIAARAGVTVATVENVLAGAPVSLSTPVFDDDSATMQDLLADSISDEHDTVHVPSFTLVCDQLSAMDIMVAALRFGLTGRPHLTVNRTADALGIGRGVVNNAQRRVSKAVAAYRVASGSLLDEDEVISDISKLAD